MSARLSRRALVLLAAALALSACAKGDKKEGLAAIKERGVLRVGVEGTYPPFNFQGKDGALAGYEIDFGKAVAAKMGLKAEFIQTPFAGLLGGLESGRLDVVANQISMTPERQAKYGFSQPYTISGIQIILRKDDARPIATPADLAGKKVGVGLGTNYEAWLRSDAPTAVVKTYDDDPTKYQDLKAGRIDAVLNDKLVVLDLIKSGAPIKASGPSFARTQMGVAFKQSPELKTAVDKAIDDLRASGELAAISIKWFGQDVTK
ncbi:cystine ABC transporter substrate-binding protein [Caulobacter sp. 73W]|uniref:Cystine ABC transporter substrate-binding protein n=1 Tax=Caulobacter sp. 73W TaxID=3161137 RepID=A0AB39KTB7_9CAUL